MGWLPLSPTMSATVPSNLFCSLQPDPISAVHIESDSRVEKTIKTKHSGLGKKDIAVQCLLPRHHSDCDTVMGEAPLYSDHTGSSLARLPCRDNLATWQIGGGLAGTGERKPL
jgi:hypothetical protein